MKEMEVSLPIDCFRQKYSHFSIQKPTSGKHSIQKHNSNGQVKYYIGAKQLVLSAEFCIPSEALKIKIFHSIAFSSAKAKHSRRTSNCTSLIHDYCASVMAMRLPFAKVGPFEWLAQLYIRQQSGRKTTMVHKSTVSFLTTSWDFANAPFVGELFVPEALTFTECCKIDLHLFVLSIEGVLKRSFALSIQLPPSKDNYSLFARQFTYECGEEESKILRFMIAVRLVALQRERAFQLLQKHPIKLVFSQDPSETREQQTNFCIKEEKMILYLPTCKEEEESSDFR